VYFIYGMYECLNLVAEPKDVAGCILIRALEPIHGQDIMATRRGRAIRHPRDLANGPGKLTLAMGITRPVHNGVDVTDARSPLTVREPETGAAASDICVTTRIGIRHSADLPLRFYLRNNAFVSKP
jgi:DNA-3-methyladenine glycosylase